MPKVKKSSTKAILCDLGNVLINFDHRIAVRRVLPYAGKKFKFEDIYQIFFDCELVKDYEEGRITSSEFFKELKKSLGLKNLSFKKFASIWSEIFFDNTGMIKLLEELKKKYRLHLISNINELHYKFIAKNFARHIDIFDKHVLSYEVGKRKPALEIYRAAIEDSGFERHEVLYIDDRQDLISVAEKLGIPSVVFKGVKALKKELNKLKVY